MSKLKLSLLTTFLVAALNGQAYAACEAPTAPIIPDGNVASQDELIAAQKAMKTFQAVLGDYRSCLDEMTSVIDLESEEGLTAKVANDTLYDSSVVAEEGVAEQFNAAVRAYKAKGN